MLYKNHPVKIIFLVLTIPFVVFKAGAQDKDDDSHYRKGISLFKQKIYDDALLELLKCDTISGKNDYVFYYIGLTYLELKKPAKALAYLKKSKERESKSNDIDWFLGKAFHLNHQFDDAIKSFTSYKATLKDAEKEKIAETEKFLTYCRNGKELMLDPIKVEIKNIGNFLNTEFPEYNPLISADESSVIFTSRRPDSKGKRLDPKDMMYYEDVYVWMRKDTVWQRPVTLGNNINTAKHDAAVGLSPDGQHLIVYNATSGNGDLLLSKLASDKWSKPKSLGKNINSEAWESSGSISSNNNTIFFSSNRKGGVGGTDIYMSKRQENGEFAPAILLGPQVNTPDDEIAPFIHADGQTLYFSSRGHRSMGGFDIFSVKIDLETGELLSDAENIRYPINTAGDDFHFVWSADNTRAYFSSVRDEGKGDKDIYMLERNIEMTPLVVWKGLVLDCITERPILSTITVTDNSTNQVVGVYNPNTSTGKYVIVLPAGKNYGIAVEAKKYAFYSKNIDIPTLDSYKEIEEVICLNPVVKGTVITLRNIFFDYDKSHLRKESEAELERVFNFLKTYPDIKIEIAGHTDADGGHDYNINLSKKRAEAVYSYLVKKGINKNRLEPKGYGETKPVAPNDTNDGKQLNRRTELIIK
ncbi:MAG: OmpA family protein [Cytophagaceae bacterium]